MIQLLPQSLDKCFFGPSLWTWIKHTILQMQVYSVLFAMLDEQLSSDFKWRLTHTRHYWTRYSYSFCSDILTAQLWYQERWTRLRESFRERFTWDWTTRYIWWALQYIPWKLDCDRFSNFSTTPCTWSTMIPAPSVETETTFFKHVAPEIAWRNHEQLQNTSGQFKCH